MSTQSDKRRTHFDLSSFVATQPSPISKLENEANAEKPIWDHSASDDDTRKKLKKRKQGDSSSLQPKKQRVITKNSPIELEIVSAAAARVSALDVGRVRMKHESPWNSLRKEYDLQFDDFIPIATHPSFGLVVVKCLSGPGAEEKVDMLQGIRHENFLAFIDYFRFDDCHHVVLEYASISIANLVLSNRYPNEIQLAAILGQVSA